LCNFGNKKKLRVMESNGYLNGHDYATSYRQITLKFECRNWKWFRIINSRNDEKLSITWWWLKLEWNGRYGWK
jgi:hypothetical protein